MIKVVQPAAALAVESIGLRGLKALRRFWSWAKLCPSSMESWRVRHNSGIVVVVAVVVLLEVALVLVLELVLVLYNIRVSIKHRKRA